MSIISAVFGSSPKNGYSSDIVPLTEETLKRVVSVARISTLSESERDMVRKEILRARGSDGVVSLQTVYEILTRLEHQHKISEHDKKGILEGLKKYMK